MPAINIDANVVDGSNTKIHANPLLNVGIANALLQAPKVSIASPKQVNANNYGVLETPNAFNENIAQNILTPFALSAEPISNLVLPVDINSIDEQPVANPVNVDALASQDIQIPVDITEQASADVSAPAIFSPKEADPTSPPFPLNYARILYENLLVNSTATDVSGNNPSWTLIPNTAQRFTFATNASILFTLPVNVNMDTVCLGAHNFKGLSVLVEYDTAVAGTFSDFKPIRAITKNHSLMFHRSSEVSVRRLQITFSGNIANLPRFVGSIYGGIALQIMRPFYGGHSPAVLSENAVFFSSNSESGNFIGSEVRRTALSSEASWKNIDDLWYRSYFVDFLEVAVTQPFYLAWNLLEHEDDVVYCKNITGIAPTYQGQRNLVSMSIPLNGIK